MVSTVSERISHRGGQDMRASRADGVRVGAPLPLADQRPVGVVPVPGPAYLIYR